MLHNNSLPQDFGLARENIKSMVCGMSVRSHLIHFKQPGVDLSPIWYAYSDRMQLGGMLVERTVFDLVDARY
jgi:hypothetical protein